MFTKQDQRWVFHKDALAQDAGPGVTRRVLAYNSQYKNLLYNVTTASEFNQDFKENIDLKMYYYSIRTVFKLQ